MAKTLLMIKPDAVQKGLDGEILRRAAAAGLEIVASERRRLTMAEVEALYHEHLGKPFFKRNAEFIASGELVLCVVEGDGDIVGRVRDFMGDKDPARARKGSIRGDYGVDPARMERNLVHGSSSAKDAEREVALFFGAAGVMRGPRRPPRSRRGSGGSMSKPHRVAEKRRRRRKYLKRAARKRQAAAAPAAK